MAELKLPGPVYYDLRLTCKRCGKETIRSIPVQSSRQPTPAAVFAALDLENSGNTICRCLRNNDMSGEFHSDYYDIDYILSNPVGPLTVEIPHSLSNKSLQQAPLSSPLTLSSGYSYPHPSRTSSRSLPSLPSSDAPVKIPSRAPSCPQLPIPKRRFTDDVFSLDTSLKEICTALKRERTLDTFALVTPDRNACRPPYLVISVMAHRDRTKNGSMEFPRILMNDQTGWVYLCYFYGDQKIQDREFPSTNALLTHYRRFSTRYGGFLSKQLKRRQVYNRG